MKHIVSKELILFFDKVRSAILDEDSDQEVVIIREAALESVRSDPGLHQLVPYFVQYVAEKVTHSLSNTFTLRSMMDLTAAVITNKTLFVEPYITALIPPVLTCLVGRNLGPDNLTSLKDQYDLRDLAASLISKISAKYAHSSLELRPRLARTCLKYFLDPSRSPPQHYGAINGILAVGGAEAIRALVLPNLKPFESVLVKTQEERGEDDEMVRMLKGGILKAVSSLTAGKADVRMVNGAGAGHGEEVESTAVREFLGTVIGDLVLGVGNRALNKAVLEARGR